MNKPWGYFVALVGGALVGWIGQQFWGVTSDRKALWSDENLMTRNELRLEQLRQQSRDEPDFSTAVELVGRNQVDQLLDLVVAGQIDVAAEKYREQLSDYAQDLSLSRTIAAQSIESGDYETALTLLYEQRLFISFELEEELLKLIYSTVETIDKKLAANKQTTALISLYRLLVSLHGDYTPYYLRLTHWLIVAGEFDAAEQSLAGAVNDIGYQKEVAQLQDRISKRSAKQDANQGLGEVAVPLTKMGEHFVVEVFIEGRYPARLMIDTGASLSVISADWPGLSKLQAAVSPEPLQMNTANGLVVGQQMRVHAFTLGDQQLSDVELGVVALPGFDVDGLLGMNVLSRFEFFIDQEQQQLLLR